MRHNFFIYLFALATVALFVSSCNDQPTEVGGILLSDSVVVKTLSSEKDSIITSAEYFQYIIPSYTGETALLGRYESIDAPYLCLFYSPEDSVRNISVEDIIEAEFVMYYETYAMGDYNSGQLSFDINRVDSLWIKVDTDDMDKTTYDSLFVSPANYFGEKIGEYSGTVDFADSTAIRKIHIPIEKSYASLLMEYNENDSLDHRTKEYGLAFLPREDCSIIQQFRTNVNGYSADSTSHLRIVFNNNGVQDSVRLNISHDGMFSKSDITDNELIYVQPHVDYRSAIKIDVSQIPEFAGIIKSELELTLKEDACISSNEGVDSLVRIGIFYSRETTNSLADYVSSSGKRDSANLNKYIFRSISGAIENIVRTTNGKGEVIIYPYYFAKDDGLNHNRLDRMAFYGANAENPDNRPKLRVAYSYIESKDRNKGITLSE
jgi:hypothetical protein